MKFSVLLLFTLTQLILFGGLSARAQDSTIIHYLYEPLPLRAGENVWNLGMSLSLLPAPVVEQELIGPTLDLQFKHGFSPTISLYGGVSSNYFTNILGAGIQYNTGDDDLNYSAGVAIVGFAGIINLGGEFDRNTAGAFALIPTIRVGHRFGDVALTLLISGSYVLYANTHVGSLEDEGISSRFNDIAFELAIEQPFFGRTYVSLGIGFTYSRTPYQTWMLYNTFDQYLVVPATFFSFRL